MFEISELMIEKFRAIVPPEIYLLRSAIDNPILTGSGNSNLSKVEPNPLYITKTIKKHQKMFWYAIYRCHMFKHYYSRHRGLFLYSMCTSLFHEQSIRINKKYSAFNFKV